MTLIVTSSRGDNISLPIEIMKLLNLREGDKIKTTIEGQTLRLTPIERFLALRGVLKEEPAFDDALQSLEQAWQTWNLSTSVYRSYAV